MDKTVTIEAAVLALEATLFDIQLRASEGQYMTIDSIKEQFTKLLTNGNK
jgi:hypothetical protein